MIRLRSAAITTTPTTSLRSIARFIASSMAGEDWGCCALATNGRAAAPPTRVMNSRRFIGSFSRLMPQGVSLASTTAKISRRHVGLHDVEASRAENLRRADAHAGRGNAIGIMPMSCHTSGDERQAGYSDRRLVGTLGAALTDCVTFVPPE